MAKAKHGEKMIEVSIRFWTNNLAETKGNILPKHCWSAGTATLRKNGAHGIPSQDPIKFNTLMELTNAIEQALIDGEIKMHTGNKLALYVQS